MPFSNLLNTVLHFGFTMWQKTKDGQKTKDDNFSTEKTEEKQNSVTIMISGDGKETFFQ